MQNRFRYLIVLAGLHFLLMSGGSVHVQAAEPGEIQGKKEKKPRHLKSKAFIHWVESPESGLSVKSTQGMLDIAVQYRPSEYILLKESIADKEVLGKKELRERKKEIEGMEYFTFIISLNDGRKDLIKSLTHGSEEYEKLLLYLANDLQKDLKLKAGADTLECRLFHFERTYGLTPYVKFVVGFEPASSRKRKEDLLFLFNGHMFGMPVIPLQMRKEDLFNIPKVVL